MKQSYKYVVLPEWVIDLGLTYIESMCYAVILGFSQDGESRFKGSAKYLQKWCFAKSKTSIYNALSTLCEKGLILKFEKEVNGIKLCDYAANLENIPQTLNVQGEHQMFRGRPPSVVGGDTPDVHHIKDKIYNKDNIYIVSDETSPAKKVAFKSPTVEEVEAYGKSKGFKKTNYLDFWEYYENKGWKVGNVKMKSWQLALNRWERNQKQTTARPNRNTGTYNDPNYKADDNDPF